MSRSVAVIFCLGLVLLAGCSGSALNWLADETPTGIVWPAMPAEPRIEYLGDIADAGSAGMGGGVFNRLVTILLGTEGKRLVNPSAVVAADDGRRLIVADTGLPGVHVLSPAEGKWEVVTGGGSDSFVSPVGLATDGGMQVWITDSYLGGVFSLDLKSLRADLITPEGSLTQPVGIVYLATDTLVVADAERHQLVWLTPGGEVIRTEGERGTEPGQFNYPTMLTADRSGRLLVADTLNFRIQIREQDGWSRVIGGPGDGSGYFSRPKGIALDSHGNLYVMESYYGVMSIFDSSTGAFNMSLGRTGSEPGEFRLPIGVFVDRYDRIFVADTSNGRIQVFRYVGESN